MRASPPASSTSESEDWSGFVARAVEHELERDALVAYLDELDDEFGEVPADVVEEYDELWPS